MCSCPRVGNTRHWLSTLAARSSVSRNVANGLLGDWHPSFSVVTQSQVRAERNGICRVNNRMSRGSGFLVQAVVCRGVAFLANRKSVHSEEGWPVVPPTDPRKSLEKPDHNK
jgi:hypothetical protein